MSEEKELGLSEAESKAAKRQMEEAEREEIKREAQEENHQDDNKNLEAKQPVKST